MPGRSHASPAVIPEEAGPTTSPEERSGPATAGSGRGNAAAAERARSDDGVAAGLASYQATLGAWLGGELYRAVSRELSSDKLQELARQGLEQVLKDGSAKLLLKADGEVDEDAVASFGDALAAKWGGLAADWLATDDGRALVEALRGWVDANPEAVATVALLAAGAAVVANMEIPELKRHLELREGLTLDLSAKLGRLRAVALERVKARLGFESGALVAAMEVERAADGSVTGSAEATWGGDEDPLQLQAKGSFTERGLEVAGLEAIRRWEGGEARASVEGGPASEGKAVVKAALETTSGRLVHSNGVEWDGSTGLLTITDAEKLVLDGATWEGRTRTTSDGDASFAISREGGTGIAGLDSTVTLEHVIHGRASAWDLPEEDRLAAGLSLDRGRLAAELQGEWSSTGAGSLSGSVGWEDGPLSASLEASGDTDGARSVTGRIERTTDDGHTAGLEVSREWGPDDRLLQVGAWYGFQDPDEFRTWLARYTYDSADRSQAVSLLLEHRLGEIYARLKHETVLSAAGMRHDTTLEGARFVADDVAIIAGLRASTNERGEHGYAAELGLQVGDVPLTVQYDPKNRAVSVGLTLKFGR